MKNSGKVILAGLIGINLLTLGSAVYSIQESVAQHDEAMVHLDLTEEELASLESETEGIKKTNDAIYKDTITLKLKMVDTLEGK